MCAQSNTTAPVKAAFFDIDGTLTSFNTHSVPDSTVTALGDLKAKGVKIFICTGRAPSQLHAAQRMIPVDFDGYITLNGQYCYDASGFKDELTLDKEDIGLFIDYLKNHPTLVSSFAEVDYTYFNQDNKTLRDAWSVLGKSAPDVQVDTVQRALEHPTYQMSPFIHIEQEQEIVSKLPHTKGVRWHRAFTDLIPAEGGKSRGIRCFIDHLGLEAKETMAFGDGGNDADMLAFAGIGVAMGGATPNAKASADYITTEVDDDGILNALRHFHVL
ncbi:MAG: Cof-type HAD-IIB family hydrolase [Bifidobacterium crudilactis]|jgi:Cof subfamily protein (haloacid dehalogenase superfamily)|nr:Cof-type HAD-IIB family hydrolase [Bifidobacterium crudilactis]